MTGTVPPEVSIVLPVYNGERYLSQSIESVLDQDYEKFELLICDDASSDNSASLIDTYHDPRISLFRNDSNLGLFPTLNRLIRRARGRYIKLWAQDDVMKPSCISTHLQFHRQHSQVGMSFAASETIDAAGRVLPTPAGEFPAVIGPELACRLFFYYGSLPGNISTVMLDRAALDHAGLFREDMAFAGDFERWIAISRVFCIGYIAEPLIYLRRHDGQLSRNEREYLNWVVEGGELFDELLHALPADERAYGRRFMRRQVLRQYAHYMVRCLVRGNLKGGIDTWRAIRRFDNPGRVLGVWLVTGNGRWFSLPPLREPG